jgi:hypothetical protein
LIITYYARRNITTIFTGKELHPDSYFIGTEGPFTAVKRPGREADHSSSFEVENEQNCAFIPSYVFMTYSGTNISFLYHKNTVSLSL